jgi:hypothetical protein
MGIRDVFNAVVSIPPSLVVTAGLIVAADVALVNNEPDMAKMLGVSAAVTGVISAINAAKAKP